MIKFTETIELEIAPEKNTCSYPEESFVLEKVAEKLLEKNWHEFKLRELGYDTNLIRAALASITSRQLGQFLHVIYDDLRFLHSCEETKHELFVEDDMQWFKGNCIETKKTTYVYAVPCEFDIDALIREYHLEKPSDKCKWILYDYRTICPEEHGDVCDGSSDKPFWRLPERYKDILRYCPYCGKEIDFSEIDEGIARRQAQ